MVVVDMDIEPKHQLVILDIQYTPSWSTRPNITPIYPGPENYAQPGAYATGGGGGGTA